MRTTIRNARSRTGPDRQVIDALLLLERACFDPQVAFKRRQLAHLVSGDRSSTYVAWDGDRLVGQITVLRRWTPAGERARIYNLAVLPASRARGLGAALLRHGLAALRRAGVQRVFAEVESSNGPSLRLFERLGFRATRPLPDYYGRGRAGVKMVAELGGRGPGRRETVEE